ncbi:MAG: CRISPR-associated protein Cas4 [Candidatus Hadarchaeaceae archaeon]
MNAEGYWFVSDVLNHVYCPWITFNWYVLGIPQSKTVKTREGLRAQEIYMRKVKKHPERGIGGIRGAIHVYERPVRSNRLMLAGKCDYVVYPGKQPIPLEIKNAKLPPRIPRKNHLIQLTCYCIMLSEEVGENIDFGFIHYLKDGLTQKVYVTDENRRYIEELIQEMNLILEKEIGIGKPMSWRCCIDCCYKKICAIGGGS